MKKTNLLSIEYTGAGFFISSTDPQEVKYFGELLVQKFGENKLFGQKAKNGTYIARFIFAGGISASVDDDFFRSDIKWWLFNMAIQRGWSPFGEIGSFTRIEE